MLVTQPAFRSEYVRLKNKYGKYWVSRWPGEWHLFARSHCNPACSDSVVCSFFFAEQTDPSKYVFEEIAIAAWLLALWKGESTADQDGEQQRCVRFVDLGCGNGFLTYLLIEEGHTGWGIDRQRRGIWGEYPAAVQVRELACSIEACTQNDLVQSEHDSANCVLVRLPRRIVRSNRCCAPRSSSPYSVSTHCQISSKACSGCSATTQTSSLLGCLLSRSTLRSENRRGTQTMSGALTSQTSRISIALQRLSALARLPLVLTPKAQSTSAPLQRFGMPVSTLRRSKGTMQRVVAVEPSRPCCLKTGCCRAVCGILDPREYL